MNELNEQKTKLVNETEEMKFHFEDVIENQNE